VSAARATIVAAIIGALALVAVALINNHVWPFKGGQQIVSASASYGSPPVLPAVPAESQLTQPSRVHHHHEAAQEPTPQSSVQVDVGTVKSEQQTGGVTAGYVGNIEQGEGGR
jgi:hypothetical protein